MLSVSNCRAGYGKTTVLDAVALHVNAGETLAILGSSGCGKTTLLYALAGLKQAWTGSVTLDGIPIVRGDARVGVILQQYGLFPWFTARENVALALRIRGAASEDAKQSTTRALLLMGIEEIGDRYPLGLSGGQQQRVAIARTLVTEPELLLMDEPFSALDAITREALQDALRELLRERRIATVLVTHSVEEAVYLGTKVGILHGRPAQLTVLDNPLGSAGREEVQGRQLSQEDMEASRELRVSHSYLRSCAVVRERFGELAHGSR